MILRLKPEWECEVLLDAWLATSPPLSPALNDSQRTKKAPDATKQKDAPKETTR